MGTLGKIIGWLLGGAAVIVGGLYLLGSRPDDPPGKEIPWVTPQEAYEDQTARTAMDGGAFVTFGLKIRDPREVCREEGDYVPNTYAIHNGSFETLESGETIYVRHEDGLQRRSVWAASDRCYFVDESGCVAHDTYAFDGYYAGADGAWDESVPRLTADTRPTPGRKYREEGNPTGVFLLFDVMQSGDYSVIRTYPTLDYSETYRLDPFGRGTYALEKVGDTDIRAHLALLPDGRTAIFSQAGETQKFVVE